eukprot:UN05704
MTSLLYVYCSWLNNMYKSNHHEQNSSDSVISTFSTASDVSSSSAFRTTSFSFGFCHLLLFFYCVHLLLHHLHLYRHHRHLFRHQNPPHSHFLHFYSRSPKNQIFLEQFLPASPLVLNSKTVPFCPYFQISLDYLLYLTYNN